MSKESARARLSGRRVLVPGGTGGVGEGVVRAYLAAGAEVVVPTRSTRRAEDFRRLLGPAAIERLHVTVRDYTTFEGADGLAAEMTDRLGGIDDVVAPIGGFWGGRRLWEIDQHDWEEAFTELSTTHLAVMRAALPRLGPVGAYQIIAGESALTAVPGSGLLSMQQSALLMMQMVLAAEAAGRQRVFALILGPVRTRAVSDEQPGWITPGLVGDVATAVSASTREGGQIRLSDPAAAAQALTRLRGGRPDDSTPVLAATTMRSTAGARDDLVALLHELAPRIRAEPGCLRYSVHLPQDDSDRDLLVIMAFSSAEAYAAHSARISPQIPRISALLDAPLAPPVLYNAVVSVGDPSAELTAGP